MKDTVKVTTFFDGPEAAVEAAGGTEKREGAGAEEHFASRVYEAVKRIPKGHVATYGQIAAIAGSPHAARAVGNILHRNPDEEHIPCFRVVNAQGKLSGAFAFGGIDVQRKRLEEDGVEVVNMQVDLAEYGWRPGEH